MARGYVLRLTDHAHTRRGHEAAMGALWIGALGVVLGIGGGPAGMAFGGAIFAGLGAGLGSLSHGYPTLYWSKRLPGRALEVQSTPTEADLAVDGKRAGKTPYLTWLSSGTHTVTVWKPGYKTWQGTLTAGYGTSNKFNPILEKAE